MKSFKIFILLSLINPIIVVFAQPDCEMNIETKDSLIRVELDITNNTNQNIFIYNGAWMVEATLNNFLMLEVLLILQ